MHKFFEVAMEIWGWIRIMLSPLLGGCLIGLAIYYYYPTVVSMVIGIFLVLVGLIVGILLATRIWKKYGTMRFLSRISATPELDKVDDKEN